MFFAYNSSGVKMELFFSLVRLHREIYGLGIRLKIELLVLSAFA